MTGALIGLHRETDRGHAIGAGLGSTREVQETSQFQHPADKVNARREYLSKLRSAQNERMSLKTSLREVSTAAPVSSARFAASVKQAAPSNGATGATEKGLAFGLGAAAAAVRSTAAFMPSGAAGPENVAGIATASFDAYAKNKDAKRAREVYKSQNTDFELRVQQVSALLAHREELLRSDPAHGSSEEILAIDLAVRAYEQDLGEIHKAMSAYETNYVRKDILQPAAVRRDKFCQLIARRRELGQLPAQKRAELAPTLEKEIVDCIDELQNFRHEAKPLATPATSGRFEPFRTLGPSAISLLRDGRIQPIQQVPAAVVAGTNLAALIEGASAATTFLSGAGSIAAVPLSVLAGALHVQEGKNTGREARNAKETLLEQASRLAAGMNGADSLTRGIARAQLTQLARLYAREHRKRGHAKRRIRYGAYCMTLAPAAQVIGFGVLVGLAVAGIHLIPGGAFLIAVVPCAVLTGWSVLCARNSFLELAAKQSAMRQQRAAELFFKHYGPEGVRQLHDEYSAPDGPPATSASTLGTKRGFSLKDVPRQLSSHISGHANSRSRAALLKELQPERLAVNDFLADMAVGHLVRQGALQRADNQASAAESTLLRLGTPQKNVDFLHDVAGISNGEERDDLVQSAYSLQSKTKFLPSQRLPSADAPLGEPEVLDQLAARRDALLTQDHVENFVKAVDALGMSEAVKKLEPAQREILYDTIAGARAGLARAGVGTRELESLFDAMVRRHEQGMEFVPLAQTRVDGQNVTDHPIGIRRALVELLIDPGVLRDHTVDDGQAHDTPAPSGLGNLAWLKQAMHAAEKHRKSDKSPLLAAMQRNKLSKARNVDRRLQAGDQELAKELLNGILSSMPVEIRAKFGDDSRKCLTEVLAQMKANAETFHDVLADQKQPSAVRMTKRLKHLGRVIERLQDGIELVPEMAAARPTIATISGHEDRAEDSESLVESSEDESLALPPMAPRPAQTNAPRSGTAAHALRLGAHRSERSGVAPDPIRVA